MTPPLRLSLRPQPVAVITARTGVFGAAVHALRLDGPITSNVASAAGDTPHALVLRPTYRGVHVENDVAPARHTEALRLRLRERTPADIDGTPLSLTAGEYQVRRAVLYRLHAAPATLPGHA